MALQTLVFSIASTYINLSGIQKFGNSLVMYCFCILVIF